MDRIASVVLTSFLAPAGVALAADARQTAASGPQAPNILWITAEDLGLNLGCYGDPDAVTPNLDQFASEGIRYTNVFSVHPCCSPSRSCLATGVYPTRLGTFQHRAKMWVSPERVRCFTTLLREAGYYCFNGSQGGGAKLDYNFEPKDEPWNKVGSKQVEWRNRRVGQPFFGQINLACTHQSQYGKRRPGTSTAGRPDAVHDPARVRVPSYHPDTPAVREIWAEYHDRVAEMDQQFAALRKLLADDGLADETIIFFFGDNGHGVPGGKVWLWDQGPHVPLIAHFPKRYAHLAPARAGGVSGRLVSFLDFAPTMLSLAGVEIPGFMQGLPFCGPRAGEPRRYAFAARDFHDGADFDTSRMVRDTRFHYIRNFMPQQGWDAIQYSWEQAPDMLQQWRQQAEAGKLKADTRQACFFRRTKPAEELYDIEHDAHQMRNLAGDPQSREVLQRMRAECEKWMIENRDLGLLSQYELYVRSEKDSPYETAMDPRRNPIERLLAAANLANRGDPAATAQLVQLLKDDEAAVRRWGAIGLLTLKEQAAPAADALLAALADPAPDVRLTAAESLCGLGKTSQALPVLIDLLTHESRIIRNETLLALCRIGQPARAALPHLDKSRGSSTHSGLWSYDNIPPAIDLARACLGERFSAAPSQPKGRGAARRAARDSNVLKSTRQKYLP